MGSTTNNWDTRTFQATAVAISAYSLVQLDSAGKILVAGDSGSEQIIGVTTDDIEASGWGNVRLLNAGGTIEVLAGGDTIAIAATVYADGSGKVGTDSGNTKVGVSLQASSANNDVVEVYCHQEFLA